MTADINKARFSGELGHRPPDTPDEYARHVATYRGFVRGVALVAAHTLLVLALLAYFTT